MITIRSYATLILLLIAALCKAQPDAISYQLMTTPTIAVEEIPIDFKGASQNSFSAYVVADDGDYAKDFKNRLKSKYAIEVKKSSGYLSSPAMVVAAWSTDSVTIHYKIGRDGNGARLNFLVQQKDQFVSSSVRPDMASSVKSMLEQQIREFYIKYYDMKIAAQQKHYDNQMKDLSRLKKKSDKVAGEIASLNKSTQKAEDEVNKVNGKISDTDGKIKSLKATQEQQKRETGQIQKEIDDNLSFLKAKQAEYDSYNQTGSLNTKPAQKAMKEKEKLESKALKLQDKLKKNREAITKTENATLKTEQEATKLQSRLDRLKSDITKKKNDADSRKRDLDNVDRDIKDENVQVKEAKDGLEKLKMAKGGLINK